MNAYLVLLQWGAGRITANVIVAPDETGAAAIAAASCVSRDPLGGVLAGCLVHYLPTEWLRDALKQIDTAPSAPPAIRLDTLPPEGSA